MHGRCSSAATRSGGWRTTICCKAATVVLLGGGGGASSTPSSITPRRLPSPHSFGFATPRLPSQSQQLATNVQSTFAASVCSRWGGFARPFSTMMLPLHAHYEDVLRQDLLLKLNHANAMQVPGLIEIRLVPKASSDLKIQFGKLAMEILCGQKFIQAQRDPYSKARKSSRSNPFLASENSSDLTRQSVLRGHAMYHFLARILTVMSMLDSRVEVRENSIKFFMETEFCEFSPELEDHFEIFEHIRGFNVTIVTSASTKDVTSLLWSGLLLKDEGDAKSQN